MAHQEDEDQEDTMPKEPLTATALLLCELVSKIPQNSDEARPKNPISDPSAQWIAVHGAKTAAILENETKVEIIDVCDPSEAKNGHENSIQIKEKVQSMAFSACGEFIAVADAAGILSLYKSNGKFLFGHQVVRAGGSDSVVSIKFATSEEKIGSCDSQALVVVTKSGMLLRLGDLRLAEFEQLLVDNPKDGLRVILRNIRFERTDAGRLKDHTQSCMLVHRFQSEEYVILGNHGTFGSVWKTSLLNEEGRAGIEKISVCEFRSGSVQAMALDSNHSLLVILSEGKLSWYRWNWLEMTELFEADISGIMSFALLEAYSNTEEERRSASLLAVVRSPEDEDSEPLLELVRILHPEAGGDADSSCVVSSIEYEYFRAKSKITNVALFGRDSNPRQVFAAYRTHRGISILLLSGDDYVSSGEAAESFDGESGDTTFNTGAVVIAESLVDIPVSSLLHKGSLKKYQAKLAACTNSIGDNDDDSRAVLERLLRVAAGIRGYTSSSPESSTLPASLLRWCNEISELSYKWTTFQLLRSSSAYAAETNENTLREKWDLFRNMPVVAMLEKYIKMGSMRAVMILWGRHLDDDAVRNIGKLLRYLPTSLPFSFYGDWIQNEVISTLIHHAEHSEASETETPTEVDRTPLLAELALWILERSEAAAAKGDLETAIRICNLLGTSDGENSASTHFSFYELKLQTSTSYPRTPENGDANTTNELDVFERIERLKQKLRHVKRLATKHHFIISLSVFEDETPAAIAMSMLDRVFDSKSLQKEIQDHVKKYLQFCDVDVDPVLHDYVTELAESIQTSHSTEEIRALVLLDEISDVNIRADATLTLLRSSLPPYSQALKSYANDCIHSWKTERLEKIEEHVRLMEIQDMLTTYGVQQLDIANAKSASRLVSHILNQVSRPATFTDAMLLVDAYSDLQCDRAVVRFTENLISDADGVRTTEDVIDEVSLRVEKAMAALSELKRRKEPNLHISLYVSLMEEIVEFGVMLLEMEAEEKDGARQDENTESQSFIVCMLKALVAAYLPELKTTLDFRSTTPYDSISAYVESPDYMLCDTLLADLQRIDQVMVDYGILLSVSVLRDPEKCESKLKQMMKPEVLFTDDCTDTDTTRTNMPAYYVRKGKGKKRTVLSREQSSLVASKRQRTDESGSSSRELQQDDEKTRLIFDLNRFASAVGIDSKACQSLIAQSAAKHGSILQAVRFSRELFSKISSTRTDDHRVSKLSDPNFHPVEALKKIAISLSLYTAGHVQDIYGVPFTRRQQLLPAQVARVQAPMYTLELLRFALCMCDEDSFDELLVLLKNTLLVHEVLRCTQHSLLPSTARTTVWTVYPRWYRGDACALPSYETMKLATRFAIAEHKNLRREVESRDTIASKRYVSLLVEQRADLLSLQALMSMQDLSEAAASVVNTQMGKLLSTVFQSQEIDNYLALGLMLSMKLEDAFHAFRKQISRENVAKDFNRFQNLAVIGADAARAWQQIAFLHQCIELEGNARWWHYLNLLGIECNHKAFQSERRDLKYIRQLVPTLITRSNYDFYTVLEFTRHYQIDDSFSSLAYTEALLLEKSTATNLDYQDKIAGVIEDIHQQQLVKLLLKSISKISGQDYDRLLFIFRLLLEKTSYSEREEVERRVEILCFLKSFAAFRAKEASDNGDKLVKQTDYMKISFHELIAEPREMLARIVTKANFSALIGLADPLRLEPDELQMLLLKNMIATNLNPNTSVDSTGNTSMTQFSAFEDILRCLSDTESRVTAAEWLAESFPLGDEKLEALEFALNAAISGQNGREDPSNTSFTGHEALTRLETKILRVKVEVLLRTATSQTSSLAEVINDKEQTNQLLALVSDPKKLFLELYRRYALWFYTHNGEMLHAVASSIGDLLNLPQSKLRLEVVGEWLVKEAVHIKKNDLSRTTKEDPFELLDEERLQQADEDFGKRILYLATASVKSGDAFGDQILDYLVEFAKDSRPRAGVTFRAKLRALRVILKLGRMYQGPVERFATNKYGIENAKLFFRELLNYTRHCTHMVTFEEHRVPYDMTFVLKSNKEVLTRSFLRRFPPDQPWVFRCASQLMLDFRIEASDLWEDVLTNMLKLGMARSLATIMGPLSRKSFVRSLECGRQVWEDVLIEPMIKLKHEHSILSMDRATLQRSDSSSRDGKGDICTFAGIPVANVRPVLERMVYLLQRCPFLGQIDVPSFVIHLRDLTAIAEEERDGAEIARQLGLYGFAVKCAMVIPKPVARFEALVRIIRAGAYGSVLHELLDTSYFLDGEQSEKAMDGNREFTDNFRLIQESFSEAAKREDHSSILGTPFEPGFVEYLAATADIDYLLSLLLEEKRMETALNAVELYYEYHLPAAPRLDADRPGDEEAREDSNSRRWELIDAYVASSNSPHLQQFRAS